jgi:hypothetical protein
MAKKVRYTQPLLGEAAGYLVGVPGASVTIRQNGVTCNVYADAGGTALANPVPTGVAAGAAGLDAKGNLVIFLTPGSGYDAVASISGTSSTFAISDIPPDVTDVADAAATTAALGLKADTAAMNAADALLVPLTQRGAANGVATLGADSKIPGAQLPALAIGETFTAASQAAMLALAAQRGDVAVRTDLDPDGFFLLTSDSPTTLADWVQITAPGAVVSVNGQTGAVTGLVDTTTAQSVSGAKTALGDWTFKSGRPWRDPGGTGDDATDNNASSTGLLQTAFNAAQAIPGAGAGTGLIRLERGTFRYSTGVSVATGAIHVKGATRNGTVLKPVGAIVGIDVQTSGSHTFEDLTLDGSLLTTDAARLLRLGNGVSFCSFVRVRFVNIPAGIALELFGALDNYFEDCLWSVNNRHVLLGDSGSYPSNQNTFHAPKFTDATATTGAAVEVVNGDGNVFEGGGLAQGNNCFTTFLIRNTAGGQATGRANKIRNMWMESNGNAQPGSRGISLEGVSTAERLVGTIIDGNQLLSSVQDDPSSQVYCTNTDSTVIDNCLANLGTPNISVEKGPGNINLHVGGSNKFAGIVQASGSPVVAARWSGGPQTIVAAAAPAKLTGFTAEDIDNNGNFASSTFTCDVAGTYRVAASLELENANDTQIWRIHFYVNGASYRDVRVVAVGTGQQPLRGEATIPLAAGQTLEVWAENTQLNSRNVGAGSVVSIARVAA